MKRIITGLLLLFVILTGCNNTTNSTKDIAKTEEFTKQLEDVLLSQDLTQMEELTNTYSDDEIRMLCGNVILDAIGVDRNWIENATEDTLLVSARECARLEAKEDGYIGDITALANMIVNNPNQDAVTDAVLMELLGSPYNYVWKIVTSSDKVNENILVETARKCATLEANENGYIGHIKDLANMIVNNPNQDAVTPKVLNELLDSPWYYSWEAAAGSNKIDESTLVKAAQKCAGLKAREDDGYIGHIRALANTIVNNPNEDAVTLQVLNELLDSPWYYSWEAAAGSNKIDESTLVKAAQKCAELETRDDGYIGHITELADTILSTPNQNLITGQVLNALSKSSCKDVINLTYEKMMLMIREG